MTAHTPGPWTACEHAWPEQIGCCPLVGRPYSIHADADYRNVAAATTIANAHLIAAAPNMLAALEMCMEAGVPGGEARMAARSALAKARGVTP